MAYLGIDGGGTKTTLALVDNDGTLIGRYEGGPSNPQSTPIGEVESTLEHLVETIRKGHLKSFERIESVFAGIAGTENRLARTRLHDTLSRMFDQTVIVNIYNDALTALYSGTGGHPGIVNICGTGSITYGKTSTGKEIRIGGWGYLTDHHGSGYGVGRLGIQKALEAYDGLIDQTILTDRIFERFSIQSPNELVPLIYDPNDGRTRIASCCEVVFDAFISGDETAGQIIEVACSDMCRNITSMIRQYFSEEGRVKIVLAGSVYKRFEEIRSFIEAELPNGVTLIVPKLPPVAGAVIAAYRNHNESHSQSFVDQLENTFC